MSEVNHLFKAILNLSKYHREHEKFYSQAPVENAVKIQKASRVLKTLADRWAVVGVLNPEEDNPYMGCEDLNEPSSIQEIGILFMEGEGQPVEITRLLRDLGAMADDFAETGEWLSQAMQSSWDTALFLIGQPELASVLADRHRIIANDWLAANISSLVARLISRSIDIITTIDFTPEKVRKDIAGPRHLPDSLYSAAELLDRAADLASESAILVHDNEPRWRVFRRKVVELTGDDTGLTP